MIIDTSAVLSILFAESDAPRFSHAIAQADDRLMSAASYLEAGIVVDAKLGVAAGRQFDRLVARADIKVEPVTREHADLARQAYLDFGKGNHGAGLNFGDCFAYALSKATGFPLLFKGDDFSQTDVVSAFESRA